MTAAVRDLLPFILLLEIGAGDGDGGAAVDRTVARSDGRDSMRIEVSEASLEGGDIAVDGNGDIDIALSMSRGGAGKSSIAEH